MSDFYGIEPGTIPSYVGIGGTYISSDEVPDETRQFMMAMLDHMRNLHAENPLAFETVVRHIGSMIEGTTENEETDVWPE